LIFLMLAVVRILYIVSLRVGWPYGPLVEKSCDFADT
jgi:hypothetical protein